MVVTVVEIHVRKDKVRIYQATVDNRMSVKEPAIFVLTSCKVVKNHAGSPCTRLTCQKQPLLVTENRPLPDGVKLSQTDGKAACRIAHKVIEPLSLSS